MGTTPFVILGPGPIGSRNSVLAEEIADVAARDAAGRAPWRLCLRSSLFSSIRRFFVMAWLDRAIAIGTSVGAIVVRAMVRSGRTMTGTRGVTTLAALI